jgi:hypothetical protein
VSRSSSTSQGSNSHRQIRRTLTGTFVAMAGLQNTAENVRSWWCCFEITDLATRRWCNDLHFILAHARDGFYHTPERCPAG